MNPRTILLKQLKYNKTLVMVLFLVLTAVAITNYTLSPNPIATSQVYNFESQIIRVEETYIYLKTTQGQETIGIITADTSVNHKVIDLSGDVAHIPAKISDLAPGKKVALRTFVNPAKTNQYELANISIIIEQQQ